MLFPQNFDQVEAYCEINYRYRVDWVTSLFSRIRFQLLPSACRHKFAA